MHYSCSGFRNSSLQNSQKVIQKFQIWNKIHLHGIYVKSKQINKRKICLLLACVFRCMHNYDTALCYRISPNGLFSRSAIPPPTILRPTNTMVSAQFSDNAVTLRTPLLVSYKVKVRTLTQLPEKAWSWEWDRNNLLLCLKKIGRIMLKLN